LPIAIGVVGPRAAAQAAEALSLKTSKSSPEERRNQERLPVNQRVKSAIATAPKIERDSRSKKREKRSSTARSPFGRMAICHLFATNPAKGGGVGKKVYQVVNIFGWILGRRIPRCFQGPVVS
jgi:hypothetical protein